MTLTLWVLMVCYPPEARVPCQNYSSYGSSFECEDHRRRTHWTWGKPHRWKNERGEWGADWTSSMGSWEGVGQCKAVKVQAAE